VVGKVVPALVGIPKSSGMARGTGGGTNVGSRQGMNEQDISENVSRPRARVAVKVPACLRAVGGAGLKPGVWPFCARGEARAAHELKQNFRSLVVVALHETAEPGAGQSVRDVIVLDSVTAGARPARAKGGERAHSHVDAACVLK
jgi:hypothetical protein